MKYTYYKSAIQPFGPLTDVVVAGVTQSVSSDYLLVRSTSIEVERPTDITSSRTEKQYSFYAEDSKRFGVSDYYLIPDYLVPFNIFSSSVKSGADKAFQDLFTGAYQITNLHPDLYAGFKQAPPQSPFTNQWVGGNSHRHVRLNPGSPIDSPTTRPEAFYLLTSNIFGSATIALVDPTYTSDAVGLGYDSVSPRATYLRDFVSKSPVNIKNILTTTSSALEGNYSKNYEIAITNGRSINNFWLIGNTGSILSETEVWSLNRSTTSPYLNALLPTRTSNQTVIVNRFAGPGGPEINSIGYMDRFAAEYSPYNAYPFRNTGVRLSSGSGDNKFTGSTGPRVNIYTNIHTQNDGLRVLLTRHQGKFGYDSVFGNRDAIPLNYSGTGSYIKVPSNALRLTTGTFYDNAFVQHQIPRSEINYSWISSSLSGTNSNIELILSKYTVPSGSVSVAQTFPTLRKDFQHFADGQVNFLGLSDSGVSNTFSFASLSSASLNTLSTSSRTTGAAGNLAYLRYTNHGMAGGSSFLLNNKNSHRSAQKARETNTISFLKSQAFVDSADRIRKRIVLGSSVEPCVVSKFKPTTHIINDGSSSINNEYSYGNQIFKFADNELIKNSDTLIQLTVPNYNLLSAMYEDEALSFLGTTFDSIGYREEVFPSSQNMYRSIVRGRNDFVINWWNPSPSARIKEQATGSLGAIYRAAEPGGLSIWPLDTFEFATKLLPTITSSTGYIQKAGQLQSTAQAVAIAGVTLNTTTYKPSGAPLNSRYLLCSPNYARPVISASFTSGGSISFNPEIAGHQPWTAPMEAGKEPFYYSSYDLLAEKIRAVGKDYSILPEFRMSERIDSYLSSSQGFFYDDPNFLSLTGATLQSSSADNFYKTYSHSDFLQYFDIIKSDHLEFSRSGSLKLQCSVIKKFIPYEGFYPAQRCEQLAGLLKQSYVDVGYISGSALLNSAANDPADDARSVPRPFYEAFISPGILFNTIKSSIGMPVGIMDSTDRDDIQKVRNTSGSFNDSGIRLFSLSSSFDRKLPFEAIFDPESHLNKEATNVGANAIALYASNPEVFSWTYVNAGTPSLSQETVAINPIPYGVETINRPDFRFKFAVSNFFAETLNFFIQDKNVTRITSRPSNEFNFISGTSYQMALELRKDRGVTNWSRLSAFGPPFFVAAGAVVGTAASQRYNAAYSYIPNLPSYLTRIDSQPAIPAGEWVDTNNESLIFTFNPTKSTYTIDELWSELTTSFSRDNVIANISTVTDPDFLSVVNDRNKLTSHINVFKKVRLEESGVSDIFAWVIQPKVETPFLDFSHRTGSTPANPGTYGADGYNEAAERLFEDNVGLWYQYGRVPTGSAGLNLTISDLTGSASSLADVLGFSKQDRKLGQVAEFTEVSEAVVAIPFLAGDHAIEAGVELTEDSYGKRFISIDSVKAQLARDYILGGKRLERPPIDQATIDMFDKMSKFVIPPRMDFLNNEGVLPFVMYIFPFSHKFDQQDLADIWQNLPPTSTQYGDIGSSYDKESTVIEHDISFGGASLDTLLTAYPDRLRWMLFKVKQRASNDYFRKVSTMETNPLLGNRLTTAQQLLSRDVPVTNKVAPFSDGIDTVYGYNWPYDYFSMVELVKLDAEVKLKSDISEE
jgi:hypothetical protein